ncbi:MAG: hypothetical protein ACJAXK_002101 [Yoonia sp.]|jgi:hypothetical protein
MGTSVIFLGIVSGISAAICAVLFFNLSLVSALIIYSLVGSAIIISWVLALVSQDADLSGKGIN